MTEPTNRKELLNFLLSVWETFPSLRLGQLLDNARVASGSHGSIFYIADADLRIGLLELLKGTQHEHVYELPLDLSNSYQKRCACGKWEPKPATE